VAEKMDESLAGARWAIPPAQFTWLEKDLRRNTSRPVIIAVHYPALPLPERMRRPDGMDAGSLENGAMLLEMLAGYEQVRAIFSGHVHMHFIEERLGITQVVTGSLPEYPVEYRDVQVYDDRIEVFTLALRDPVFAGRSLIAGRDWTRGTDRDRHAVISLA
jgi:hypothetical protein